MNKKIVKCSNPKNNPNCMGYHTPQSKLCKSCAPYKGETFECEHCGKDVYKAKAYGTRFCSRNCYTASGIHKGSGNYFYGGLSETDKISRQNTIDNRDSFRISEISKIQSNAAIKAWESPKLRKRQSERVSKSIANGEFNPFSNHKSGKYNNEKYDSLWELAYMLYLDTTKQHWTKKHKIRIPYYDKTGKLHHYVPDFLINNTLIVEVKPKELISYNNNDIKIRSGVSYAFDNNMDYKVIGFEQIEAYIKEAELYHEKTGKTSYKY